MSSARDTRSLPDLHRSVVVPSGTWLRRLFAFAGPAYLVSVGYMDPGNWATDLAGGARFGYRLIWVLVMSNLMAVLLQTLSARLGVVAGKDLAQACHDYYPAPLALPLWILCEIAIVACDLAEVLGAAIGLKLLFGLPLLWGVVITALDVLLLLGLPRLGMRRLEAFIVSLIATMGACFAVEMVLSRPELAAILSGFIPRGESGAPGLFAHTRGGVEVLGLRGESLYVAMGILGATVMPHNLYMHSSLVQSRVVESSHEGKREACRMNLVDTVVALNAAFLVNLAILVLAGAVFHARGHWQVARLEDAYRLLAPLLGTGIASTLFAVALLCSGQSSTVTGTLAGQIVMEGFLHVRIRPWLRRMISRGLAIIPAALVIGLRGPGAVDDLLVLSQVVLSLQLSFAVIPLITFTSDRKMMGEFVNPPWVKVVAWGVAAAIAGLNAKLVADQIAGWFGAVGPRAPLLYLLVVPALIAIGALLLYVTLAPFLKRLAPVLVPRVPVLVPMAHGPHRQFAFARALARATPTPPTISHEAHRRIAVALELGPADAAVLEHLRTATFASGAELLFLHVVESAAGRYLGPQSMDQETREDHAVLETVADEFRARGTPVTVVLGHGEAKFELARLVNEADADLLVTGSHGHRLFGGLFLGATTSGLRHLVHCEVLTVSAPSPRP